MKKLIVKCIVLVSLVAATLTVFYRFFLQPFSDRFYPKFKQESSGLFVGSSRAFLGLDPTSFRKACPNATDVLNFAFTMKTSPYGELYYNAISRKLKEEGRNGVFIVEVSPLNLSTVGDELPEEKLILSRMWLYNLDPNPEYVFRNSMYPLYLHVLSGPDTTGGYLVSNEGWMSNPIQKDSVKRASTMQTQLEEYQEIFRTSTLSDYRLTWLNKTIELLKQHGTVTLLRMPVSEQMRKMESEYCPQFDSLISDVAQTQGITYLNYNNDTSYNFVDLHHMDSNSGKSFSQAVGQAFCSLVGAKR